MNSKEQFEKWSESHYVLKELSVDFEDGEYVEPEMQYAYESWEASRLELIAALRKLVWAPCVLQEAIDASGIED